LPTPFSRTTRSLSADTGHGALLTWTLGSILLSAWLSWFFFARVTIYEVSKAARLEVERSAHPIAAPIPGRVIGISVTLGQQVREGETLANLDAGSEQLRLQEEESRLKALPPQLAALQNEITAEEHARREDHEAALAAIQVAKARHKEATAAVEFAKDNERRQTELGNAGRIPAIEAIRARSESQKLIASADALFAEIRRLEQDALTRAHQNQARSEGLKRAAATLNGQLETTHATIARLKQEIEKHVIRAPVAGQIGDVTPLQVGAYLAEGDKLGMVVPAGRLRIVGDFPPASVLGRIHPGQLARMRLDGFPWAQYGTIQARVNRVATEIRDNQVRVEFMPEMPREASILMQHGLPGSIEVGVEELSPALLVWRTAGQILSNALPQHQPDAIGH
jgi:membrane fusion protein, adhesin transport system